MTTNGGKRIASQLLTEFAVLGLLGGFAGILLAYWGVAALLPILPSTVPKFHAIRVDGWVLLFAFVLSLTTSLVFGLAPVITVAGSNPQKALAEGARAGEPVGPRRARSFVAVAKQAGAEPRIR